MPTKASRSLDVRSRRSFASVTSPLPLRSARTRAVSRASAAGAAALATVLFAGPARAQPDPAIRAEVPIQAVRLSDGTVRFAVPIRVGGRPVLAGLDTGSSGLQLFPAAQVGLQPIGGTVRATYGSGLLLTGDRVSANLAIGAVSGEVPADRVRQIGCVARRPDCGGSRVSLDRFGILGNGLPNEGFAALIGIRTQRASEAGATANPLVRLGVRRWIVVLPQPDGGAPGRLILNPTPAETANFVPVPAGERTGEVQACIDRPAPASTHVCGSAMLDTGAPGIVVFDADVPPQSRPGAPARISFGAPDAALYALGVRLDERSQMSRYSVKTGDAGSTVALHLGPLPYLAFSVLYDTTNQSISFAPRTMYLGGPSVSNSGR